ncbi:MAG: glycosyltransferase family 4 protein, partial [Halieaceae bacterium]|nr:glycosyltransferase family 4 protein [Halieaceae bacterium]
GYHKLWERYAEQGSNPLYRAAAAVESRRVRDAEVALCQRCDLVFASPNDIDALVAAGANPAQMRETYHLGDAANLERPALENNSRQTSLLYVGNLAWEPNAAGLRAFIETAWPRLKQYYPALRLDIAGRGADDRLQQLAADGHGIVLHDFVDDLEPLYQRARLSVAPLSFGAGMKVKVLSAMARGLPLVTTPVGAEGVAARHAQHLMISDSIAAMADDIARVLEDAQLWQQLATESRQLISDRYTWDGLFQSMLSAMHQMDSRHTSSALPAPVADRLPAYAPVSPA